MRDSSCIRIAELCLCISILINGYTKGNEDKNNKSDLLKVHKVDKKVSDFPEVDDFSTPEAAYAVINRVLARGEKSKWRQISVSSLTSRLSSADAEKTEVDPENVKVWLNADILEVRIFILTTAVVFAELKWNNKAPKIDKRFLEFENGRWLNSGHDGTVPALEDAREYFQENI